MKIRGLVPMLETENLKETIKFYTENLGFEYRLIYQPENDFCWASLRNGNFELAFGLPNVHTNFIEPQLTGSLYLRVREIDEAWEKLHDKVEIVYPIQDFDYGMREFGIRDCNGYVLNLGWETGEKIKCSE